MTQQQWETTVLHQQTSRTRGRRWGGFGTVRGGRRSAVILPVVREEDSEMSMMDPAAQQVYVEGKNAFGAVRRRAKSILEQHSSGQGLAMAAYTTTSDATDGGKLRRRRLRRLSTLCAAAVEKSLESLRLREERLGGTFSAASVDKKQCPSGGWQPTPSAVAFDLREVKKEKEAKSPNKPVPPPAPSAPPGRRSAAALVYLGSHQYRYHTYD